jgi:hypothetical protein
VRVASDPLVPKTLLRLRRTDAAAARRAERALDELLSDGGLADLTQHDLQTYLWFTLSETPEPLETATALARFFELAELNRYAGIAASDQTKQILRLYEERGHLAGSRAGSKAMEASGIVPPDLAELEWSEIMGSVEVDAYNRIAATLELALAAGDLRPGGRGWRLTQARLTRQQLGMPRPDGPPLLERIRRERLDLWAETGGHARRSLTGSMLPQLLAPIPPPGDVADRIAPMRWLLEMAAGRSGDLAGVPLTVTGNLARRVVQEAGERFATWHLSDRPPRSEADLPLLGELRLVLQRAGALRRSGRRLVLGTRGRALLDDVEAQWAVATASLVESDDFDRAVQEAGLMLLLQASGPVEVPQLVREVADVVAGSGWRDVGDGAPPDDRDVARAVRGLIRRCSLWSMLDERVGPEHRLRLTEVGRRAGFAALRQLAMRARQESDT